MIWPLSGNRAGPAGPGSGMAVSGKMRSESGIGTVGAVPGPIPPEAKEAVAWPLELGGPIGIEQDGAL
jgi:hypothetical protein